VNESLSNPLRPTAKPGIVGWVPLFGHNYLWERTEDGRLRMSRLSDDVDPHSLTMIKES
jgi:hypothetical protein